MEKIHQTLAAIVDLGGQVLASDKVAMVGDSRITSTKDGSEPGPPSRFFKLLHVHEAAASMRAAQLIPFSPFMRDDVKDSFRTSDQYLDWLTDYGIALAEAAGE